MSSYLRILKNEIIILYEQIIVPFQFCLPFLFIANKVVAKLLGVQSYNELILSPVKVKKNKRGTRHKFSPTIQRVCIRNKLKWRNGKNAHSIYKSKLALKLYMPCVMNGLKIEMFLFSYQTIKVKNFLQIIQFQTYEYLKYLI